ncbi:MAG: hypothetical protein HC780_21770 [Leptolyngbyaceae cyanobacterium CSU_1_3]|nr:hypothetical protein [Leptolyngbyaceae cyanobacterium CSU_1_3]
MQKLEAGKVPIQLEAIDPSLLLDSVSRHLSSSRHGNVPRFVSNIATGLPWVQADREQAEAVLMDLLGRAWKYSDADSTLVLEARVVGPWVAIDIAAQRFAPAGQRDFAPEIALCCKRVEIQGGKVICQILSDSTLVTLNLRIAEPCSSDVEGESIDGAQD